MKNCCRTTKKDKQCVRKSDGKKFTLPRKFSKQKCKKGIKGFTMRSSCAPYKDCLTMRKTVKGGKWSKGGKQGKGVKQGKKDKQLTYNKNMLNKSLEVCSKKPMTGFYRSGKCMTGEDDRGTHTVCAKMDKSFLDYTADKGNDLSSVVKPGQNWCLCEYRWQEAFDEGKAPKVKMEATNMRTDPKIRENIRHHSKGSGKVAYFSGGCFWGLETKFKKVKGVLDTDVGFMGGRIKHPTYKQVSSGTTNHAETVKVYYNESQISFDKLVSLFFKFHDPTTVNKQGPDKGKQYRSIAFYDDDEEKQSIDDYIKKSAKKIVTEVKKTTTFYEAEEEHQDYNEKKGIRGGKGAKKQFLFNPTNPKKSFDVYIDKDPSDTIPIKYTTLDDVKQTIKKLEKLYKAGKYPHKRISQVAMILEVRLRYLQDKKKQHHTLAKRYYEFLKKRTKVKGEPARKKLVFS